MSAIFDFLAAVQPQSLDGELIEARYMLAGEKPVRFYYASRAALARDATAMAAHYNCYYGVTLRRGGGTSEHCTRAGALWADIDAKLWSTAPDPLRGALDAITAFPLPASVVVCSAGGYHAYWRLEAPVGLHAAETRARVESLNAALARAVCGRERQPDHVQDVARILRLPGTVNHKTPPRPVTLTWLRPERVYLLDTIGSLLTEQYPWAIWPATATAMPSRLLTWSTPEAPCPDLLDHTLRRLSRRMRALLDTPGAGGYTSSSEADAAVAAALIGSGLTDAEALAVLLDSPRAGDHAQRKRGHERHELAYWHRTTSNAAHVGPVRETLRGRLRMLPSPRPHPGVTLPAPVSSPGMITASPAPRGIAANKEA